MSNAHVARTRLVRMRPYCSEGQLLSMYKTLIWSALEVGSICYTHADNASLTKLEKFQDSTLWQLGLSHVTIDSMATRRKVAHASMVYKQVVLGQGPDFIRANFSIKEKTCLIVHKAVIVKQTFLLCKVDIHFG